MLIDTHSHINFGDYEKDREEVIKRSLESGTWMINVGTNYETSKEVVEIAKRYKQGVFAAIGLHPINVVQGTGYKAQGTRCKIESAGDFEDILEEDFDAEKYKKLVVPGKVVAVGEIGLDYWSKPKTKKRLEEFKRKQKEIFLKQLELARELGLPVIFHCRLAHNDLLETLGLHVTSYTLQGVVHCFTGDWSQAQKYLEKGLYLGFNGIIFKLNLDEIIKKTPLERMLVETDCPFLVPPGVNTQRNEPIFVKYVAQRIAEIKRVSFEKVAEITTENAKRLFRI